MMKGENMETERAMEYICDLNNVYLQFIPVTDTTKREIKEALYLALGALKTIHDMETRGE